MANRILKPDSSNNLILQDGDSVSRVTLNSGGTSVLSDEGGTSAISIATNGEVTFAENLIMSTGKGIDFSNQASPSAGMTSELLDSYEEGDWTPKQDSGGTAFGGSAVGKYIKIGTLVNVWFDVSNWDSNDPYIYNLPFTSSSASPAGSCDINYNNVNNDAMGRIDTSATKIILSVGTGAPTVDSSSRFMGHATYRT